MARLLISCSYCKKKFLRDVRHVNECNKLGRKYYCSLRCLGESKRNKIRLHCANPFCKNMFERTPGSTSLHNFCSNSCSAKVSNLKRHKLLKACPNLNCSNTFYGENKYCSVNCVPKNKSQYTEEGIIKVIQDFEKQHKRIPSKREMYGVYKMARRYFKTWNKAVQEAGFQPNPVMFSQKYIAKDGHKCDSLSEKIIDDWFYRKRISHQRNIPYSINHMTADFGVNGVLIEFFGLKGQLNKYDRLLRKKKSLWRKEGLKVIEIYPKDLFPKNRLDQVLKF